MELAVVKRNEGRKGFHVLPKRWIVEHTLAWFRRLAKDYEFLPECSESWRYLASIHMLTKRIAKEIGIQKSGSFLIT